MWEFLMGILLGDAVSKSPFGRLVRPVLILVALGLVIAGIVYAGVVFHAISERNNTHHVSSPSSH